MISLNLAIMGWKARTFYDQFRMKGGTIVDHYDVIQEIPTQGLAHVNGKFGLK